MFGYLNKKHEHQWEFADQNLPYLNLLGDHGLQDTGIQITWLPEWPVYTLLGAEILQGDQERVGALVEDEALKRVEAAERWAEDEARRRVEASQRRKDRTLSLIGFSSNYLSWLDS